MSWWANSEEPIRTTRGDYDSYGRQVETYAVDWSSNISILGDFRWNDEELYK